MESPHSTEQFLSGGGELGECIRAIDWSQTPIGPPSGWPQSLRTTLSILLSSRFPMFLWWGPELIQFYNDAYRPSLGTNGKHPHAVGQRGVECWPEVWDTIGPLIERVMENGESFYFEDQLIPIYRNGGLEDVYWTFSYSPVRGESGTVEGVLVVCNETTGKVLNLEQAEETGRQLKSLIAEAPISTAVFSGPQFIIELANDESLKLWGKDRRVMGKPLLEAIPELKGQPFLDLMIDVYKTGKTYEGRESVARLERDGSIRDVYVNFIFKTLRDASGKTNAILAMGYDVTEQVAARQQVSDAAERLTLATEGTRMATWDLDLKTSDIIHSPRLARIFGHPESMHLSFLAMRQAVHPRDLRVVEKAFDNALKKGTYYYEARVIHPDQSVHWIQTRGKVFYSDDHVPLRMLGTMIDITERKRAERVIEESEKKFRTLADSMPQFIWTADKTGNLNYFSRSVYQYTGITDPKQLAESWWKTIHPEDRKATLKAWQEALTTGTDFLFEHRFRHHEDTYRWQLSRAVPQRDVSGKIEMWVGTSTDIHDRKLFTDELENKVLQRTNELNLLNQNLLKSNDELAQFAYVASHDLQEPLRKIQTFAGRILDVESKNLSDRGKDYFQRMQSASVRMQQLIVDLLSFSRANTNEKYFEVTDLNYILQIVKEQLKDTIDQKQAVILSSTLPVLNIISFQFEQLFTNLIANALKFSKTDVPPLIAIHADKVGRDHVHHKDAEDILYHRIVITDNGIGFEPQFNERIFQVFQRLHGKDEYPGTGIGLAICKKIIENHQGFIEASGQLNKGAVFTVYVPARN
ncbi:PAS domain-containing protein [Chryseolinea soli]|nr:PAS domain-containing protein [Chryseolinea soli]